MIKILIVDDELLVRIGLKSTLPWVNHGFTLVGEAKNAKEAEELFHKFSPDILLTDISMPGINGLELIGRLRSKKPELQSIILTHYEDFSYARDALQLGALDYILKSNLTPERLLKVLQKAKKLIPEKAVDDNSNIGSETENDKKTADAIQSFLSNVLIKNESSRTEFNNLFDDFVSFQLATISINLNLSEKLHLNQRETSVIEEVSAQILSSFPYDIFCLIHENRINYLFCFREIMTLQDQEEVIFELLNSVMTNLKKILNYYLLTGISAASDSIHSLHDMYGQAITAGAQSFFNESHISMYRNSVSAKSAIRIELDKVKLITLLRERNCPELESYIDKLFSVLKKIRDIHLFQEIFDQILEQFSLYMNENHKSDQDSQLSSSMLQIENFEKLYDFESVKMHTLNMVSLILSSDNKDNTAKMSHIIKKSINYIENNYTQNISLSNLATNVEVSRNYLSFLFKQELGLNFNHYLTKTRIEKAKKMLSETNMKVYEIADRVGFDSPYYFSKVFKESTAMTCSEYRNQYCDYDTTEY